MVQGNVFRKHHLGILLRCLEYDEAQHVLKYLHDGPPGGHYAGDTTAHKIMQVGLYWPTLFKGAHVYPQKCPIYQIHAGRQARSTATLQPIAVEEPIEQWGLDIIREIMPNSSKQHRYILIATAYFTRWVEAIPLHKFNDNEVISYIKQCITVRLCVPTSLAFDNATYFLSLRLYDFALENNIVLKHSTNYSPQENGLAESTKKNLIYIIKKTFLSHHRNWHNALSNSLWADQITPKTSIGTSPYILVYGKETILPPNLYPPTLRLAREWQGSPFPTIQSGINALVRLEEERLKTKEKFIIHQARFKRWFEKKSSGFYEFDVNDLLLKWDRDHEEKGKHTKFQALWIVPFHIIENIGHHTFELKTLGE